MPEKVKLYDLVDGVTLERYAIDAEEAVQNDPDRYTLTPPGVWPPPKRSAAAEAPDDAELPAHRRPTAAGTTRRGPARPRQKVPANVVSGDDRGSVFDGIAGIGPKYEQRLVAAGIDSMEKLAYSTPIDVAKALGIQGRSPNWVEEQGWIEAARQRNEGLVDEPAPEFPEPPVEKAPANVETKSED